MMKYTVIIIVSLLSLNAWGQDYHFSQIDKSLPLFNPAMTSAFDGYEKVSTQHRQQWIGAGTHFATTSVLGEMSIGKKPGKEKPYLGVGIFFTNDVGGDSKLTNNVGGLTASGNIPLSEGHWLSAGIQTSFNSRSADFSRLVFYNQWNGTAFDPSLNSGEMNQKAAFTYVDASLGLAYRFQKSRNVKYKSKDNSFQLGGSFQHVNQPELRFSGLTEDKLYMKVCLHTNLRIGINSFSGLGFTGYQFFQGKHKETNLGLFYILHLKDIQRLTSVANERNLNLGVYVRIPGSFAPYVGLDLGNFKFGISYDHTMGIAGTAYKHSVELNMSYMVSRRSIFKGR